MKRRTVLTIAGSDCSGGAGIQADIKTIGAHGAYAMSVITALTAQNTVGVAAVQEVPPDFVAAQLDAVFTDIFPDAVKIGMVSSAAAAEVIADKLVQYGARHIVLDPVMVATSGGKLMQDGAAQAVLQRLFPLAEVVTPNLAEAAALAGENAVTDPEGMHSAALALSAKTGGGVLIKGGHKDGDAADLLYLRGESFWFAGPHIDNPNTHGTGCTLSSAIACNLANGCTVQRSVFFAKRYVTHTIAAMLDLGHGRGPLDHACGVMRPIPV